MRESPSPNVSSQTNADQILVIQERQEIKNMPTAQHESTVSSVDLLTMKMAKTVSTLLWSRVLTTTKNHECFVLNGDLKKSNILSQLTPLSSFV